MTLPASGPISASMINVELGRPFNAAFSINGQSERGLAGVPSGPISMGGFRGKSAGGGGGGDVKSATYLGVVNGDDTGANHNIAGVPFGVAAASRSLVLTVHWVEGGASHRDLNSATIGGVAASILRQGGHSGGSTGFGVAIITAAVPSGTSGTVVLNFSGNVASIISVYSLIGHSALVATAGEGSVLETDPLEVDIAVSGNGTIIAAYSGSSNTSGANVSWGGVAEQNDGAFGDGGGLDARRSSALAVGLGADATYTVIATQGDIQNAGNALAVTSWV